ncbi:hypothetical protein K435DRAFT_663384 [Dendrothele bispora CBS 962.96]|uniref:Transposase Tc1-like domain-containing protein n=1 Tax=Dendrothele bispora (strain CBS 962.96) TaxID=1314807 RepID=A0A4S8M493_DENBC|nr:hypothetical protein K435DRAFT_663384 [Dendrothele bispora CBS 962.96]
MAYGNRRFIHRSIKERMYTASIHRKSSHVARMFSVSHRTVNRVKRLVLQTGSVVRIPARNGRPRLLNSLDLLYLEGCIELQPDMYLDELQESLLQARGVDVSAPTIYRALLKRGFRYKQVFKSVTGCPWQCSDLTFDSTDISLCSRSK